MYRKRWLGLSVGFIVVLAVIRVVISYSGRAQAFDEPAHVAAGMEWIHGTYSLDPLHPPLSRIAIALPLYLEGERFPDSRGKDFWSVGNQILNDGRKYQLNLSLARAGVLPFFVFGSILLFCWTREEFGDSAGLMAVFLFSTLPAVLAFSGVAYTDLPAAIMQFAALFAWARWLREANVKHAVLLGSACGLAIITKFTSLVFLPPACTLMLLAKRIKTQEANSGMKKIVVGLAAAALVCGIVVWGGYRFSIGHVQEDLNLSPRFMPSFGHFPAAARSALRRAVTEDVPIPAPALVQGLGNAWVLNQSAPDAYLMGRTRGGGWWYFFLALAAVKLPLAFLILSGAGIWTCFKLLKQTPRAGILPCTAVVTITAVTLVVNCNYGFRHILLLLPLMTMVAAAGAGDMWNSSGGRAWKRVVVIAVLMWQAWASVRASGDYLAYFNELAGDDPSRIALTGCDLDCGQDLLELSARLRELKAGHVSLALWSSADLSQIGFPDTEILQPFQPTAGWVAISLRAIKLGDVQHSTYPPNSFHWLEDYLPKERVGKTILLYQIPDTAAQKANMAKSN